MVLYRPVGTAELRLIEESGWREYPPRLPEQPIFYPVLEEGYAAEIASRRNAKTGDGKGYVTRFEVEDEYAGRFAVHTVGAACHRVLSVPAEELEEFNRHILGAIQVVREFGGEEKGDRR